MLQVLRLVVKTVEYGMLLALHITYAVVDDECHKGHIPISLETQSNNLATLQKNFAFKSVAIMFKILFFSERCNTHMMLI